MRFEGFDPDVVSPVFDMGRPLVHVVTTRVEGAAPEHRYLAFTKWGVLVDLGPFGNRLPTTRELIVWLADVLDVDSDSFELAAGFARN